VPHRTDIFEHVVFSDPGEDPHLKFDTLEGHSKEHGASQNGFSGGSGHQAPSPVLLKKGDHTNPVNSLGHKLRFVLFSMFGIYFR
jgi:hypothetical protein